MAADHGTEERDAHGRHAESPSEIPWRGYKDVLWRVYSEVMEDRVSMIAAGVTYYIVLAIFHAMGVLVSLYGFIADPATITQQLGFLKDMLPPGSYDLLAPQLTELAGQDRSSLSFAFITSLLIALWSATNGIKALFEAMNVAYGEEEKRGFLRLNLQAIGFTLGALATLILLIVAVGIVPAVLSVLYLDQWAETLARLARWPLLLLVIGGASVMIYRYGPSREDAKLRWINWGVAFSTILWAVATILFSIYLLNFANYNATYGTLGTLIGFMVWIWISVIILIVGAEINAELEHQTRKDSTTGPDKPMGERGAVMADTVGETAD